MIDKFSMFDINTVLLFGILICVSIFAFCRGGD